MRCRWCNYDAFFAFETRVRYKDGPLSSTVDQYCRRGWYCLAFHLTSRHAYIHLSRTSALVSFGSAFGAIPITKFRFWNNFSSVRMTALVFFYLRVLDRHQWVRFRGCRQRAEPQDCCQSAESSDCCQHAESTKAQRLLPACRVQILLPASRVHRGYHQRTEPSYCCQRAESPRLPSARGTNRLLPASRVQASKMVCMISRIFAINLKRICQHARRGYLHEDTIVLAFCILDAMPPAVANSLPMLPVVTIITMKHYLPWHAVFMKMKPPLVVQPLVVPTPLGQDVPVVQALQAVATALHVLTTRGGHRNVNVARSRGRISR